MSLDKLDGYSVAKEMCDDRYRVYRNGEYVACIGRLGELFDNMLAFEWHDQYMWPFRASDFVR